MSYSGIFRLALKVIRFPAILKGADFASNAFIGPGYDWLAVRWKGVVIMEDVLIGRNAWIEIVGSDPASQIIIGTKTNIGRNVTISCKGKVVVGSGCLISYNVSLIDHDHQFFYGISPMETGTNAGQDIVIESNCFIGAHCFVLKGVALGRNCVVAANSVVTKSFPAGSVIAGSPARVIGRMS
jgi:acetyltransferase-like isoleucine patch superfamily enzyme